LNDAVTTEEGFGEFEHVADAYEHKFRYQALAALYVDTLRTAEGSTGVERDHYLTRAEALRSQLNHIATQLGLMGVRNVPTLHEIAARSDQ